MAMLSNQRVAKADVFADKKCVRPARPTQQ